LAHQHIEFRVLFSPASSLSLVIIGFSDHGRLAGTDICLFRVRSQQMVWQRNIEEWMTINDIPLPQQEDGWLDKQWKMRRDIHQDCQLSMAIDADQTAVAGGRYGEFRFRRKFATCDPRDYRIEVIN
jgi:hypothetical protein